MAYCGLRKPIVFALTGNKYSAGVAFGKAVSFSETPNVVSATVYGDDAPDESERATTSDALVLGTTDIPDNCKTIMFGHVANESEYEYNKDDMSPYVGFSVIGVKKIGGVRKYEAKAYPKVQWEEPSLSMETRGESVSFSTPSTNGTAYPNDEGVIKWEETFDTEAAATEWINKKFGITA